jgi:hypothetical protein
MSDIMSFNFQLIKHFIYLRAIISSQTYLIVRYNGMHKQSMLFNLKGQRNQGQGCYEGNVRSEVRF